MIVLGCTIILAAMFLVLVCAADAARERHEARGRTAERFKRYCRFDR